MTQAFTGSSCALIACSVFEDEINKIVQEHELEFTNIIFLPMGLHNRTDELRQTLQAKIDELEQKPETESIILAYALCGNGLIGIKSQRCQLVLPRADDCIGVLMGGMNKHRAYILKNPATYFYSPGWIREKRVPGPDRAEWLRQEYAGIYDEDMIEEMIEVDEENFGHHNCAAYLDITNNTQAEAYCKNCAAHQGWDFKRLQADASLLIALLKGDWSSEHFLVTNAGETLVADSYKIFTSALNPTQQ